MARTETLNRRRHDRVPARLTVGYGPSSVQRQGDVESISEGGMYINTNDVYKVGTRLVLHIAFPERTVTQFGEVVWAIRVPEHMRQSMICGMGIRFINPDPNWPTWFRSWKLGGNTRG